MKKVINGKKYLFVIYLYKCRNDYCFYIEAVHKQRLVHSFINNLNCILSEFGIEGDDKRAPESQWDSSKKEAIKFFKMAKDFLSDKWFRDYIEKQLNLDRKLGEWNPISTKLLE